MLEDLALQPLEVGAGLEAELLGERAATLLVDLQRLALAVGAVQGQHELPAQPLAQRMLADEQLELADQLAVAAEGELGLELLLPCRDP